MPLRNYQQVAIRSWVNVHEREGCFVFGYLHTWEVAGHDAAEQALIARDHRGQRLRGPAATGLSRSQRRAADPALGCTSRNRRKWSH